MSRPPPEGFELITFHNPFTTHIGPFYMHTDAHGVHNVGAYIEEMCGSNEGFAHGGYLLAFADYALTYATKCLTLNISTDFFRPVRVGAWIEGPIIVRKQSDSVVFADMEVTSDGKPIMLARGLFRPFRKS